MSQATANRIAKNTLLLYFRMILTLGIGLYTVRIILSILGFEDYGIYNVVGGIITMFGFLSNTLASAIQRFFAFQIGKSNINQLSKLFSSSLFLFFVLGLVIFVLAELGGLWFLNHKMNIPQERMEAARWVFHFALLSFLVTMCTIPYNSLIIAYEKMNAFAYISIAEVTLKLAIVFLLNYFNFDKLKLYALLFFGASAIIAFTYIIYGVIQFRHVKIKLEWEKRILKELLSYSGWSLFGALSSIFKNQGTNILLNIFFGPIVNAARGIAFQINNALLQLTNNFFTAIRPQIIKSYAAKDYSYLNKLIFQSTKYSYYLVLVFSIPLLVNTNFILKLWLTDIPESTVIFTKLVIIDVIIESMSFPLMALIQATGKIKTYQIVVGGIRLLNLPLSYLFLTLGFKAEVVFFIGITLTIICNFMRVWVVNKNYKINIPLYIKLILKKILLPTLVILAPIYFVGYESCTVMHQVIANIIFIEIGIIFIISVLGLEKLERKYIYKVLHKRICL